MSACPLWGVSSLIIAAGLLCINENLALYNTDCLILKKKIITPFCFQQQSWGILYSRILLAPIMHIPLVIVNNYLENPTPRDKGFIDALGKRISYSNGFSISNAYSLIYIFIYKIADCDYSIIMIYVQEGLTHR